MSMMGEGGDGVVRYWSDVSDDWGSVDYRGGVVARGLVDYCVETGITFYNTINYRDGFLIRYFVINLLIRYS